MSSSSKAKQVEDHPHYKRVKTWLWIHDRYRQQANALLDETTYGNTNPSGLLSAFEKFHSKIQSHSEFEDTQLFKFFQEEKIGNQETLEKLNAQHNDIRLSTNVVEGIQKLIDQVDGATYEKDAKPHLEEYVKDLMEHLEVEEDTIVDLWLNLTFEQYKTYRTYLSWKYCFMY